MGYIRLGTIPLGEVLPLIGERPNAVFLGTEVGTSSLRLRTFKEKGLVCVKCGVEGDFFAVERFERAAGNVLKEKYHINLYAQCDDGEKLMTKDHIIPVSLGGPDHIDNMQTMCTTCNVKKGTSIIEYNEKLVTDRVIAQRLLDIAEIPDTENVQVSAEVVRALCLHVLNLRRILIKRQNRSKR